MVMSEKTYADRRTVLRATGGLVGLGVVAGTASAACYYVEVAGSMADVYDSCDGSYLDCVKDGATGTTCDKCYDDNGDTWWYCVWDNASPDGWVHESQVNVGM